MHQTIQPCKYCYVSSHASFRYECGRHVDLRNARSKRALATSEEAHKIALVLCVCRLVDIDYEFVKRQIKTQGIRPPKGRVRNFTVEIRPPHSSSKIWVGTYNSLEEAMRAYDLVAYAIGKSPYYYIYPENYFPTRPNSNLKLTKKEIQRNAKTYSSMTSDLKINPECLEPLGEDSSNSNKSSSRCRRTHSRLGIRKAKSIATTKSQANPIFVDTDSLLVPLDPDKKITPATVEIVDRLLQDLGCPGQLFDQTLKYPASPFDLIEGEEVDSNMVDSTSHQRGLAMSEELVDGQHLTPMQTDIQPSFPDLFSAPVNSSPEFQCVAVSNPFYDSGGGSSGSAAGSQSLSTRALKRKNENFLSDGDGEGEDFHRFRSLKKHLLTDYAGTAYVSGTAGNDYEMVCPSDRSPYWSRMLTYLQTPAVENYRRFVSVEEDATPTGVVGNLMDTDMVDENWISSIFN